MEIFTIIGLIATGITSASLALLVALFGSVNTVASGAIEAENAATGADRAS